jgi:hypothetical protein
MVMGIHHNKDLHQSELEPTLACDLDFIAVAGLHLGYLFLKP